MKKLIIILLCCGVLISMVGCGGNTAPPPTESLPTTVSETVITETPAETIPATTAVEPTEKEKETVTTDRKEQATMLITIVPSETAEPTEETKPTKTVKTTITIKTGEKATSPVEETVLNATPQITESETSSTEPTKETSPKPDTSKPEFDINYWITFAKEYAVGVSLVLESQAVSCWDTPIRAGAHCVCLERDIQSRLNRYAKDENITDVWIWAGPAGNNCYDIYIGYA